MECKKEKSRPEAESDAMNCPTVFGARHLKLMDLLMDIINPIGDISTAVWAPKCPVQAHFSTYMYLYTYTVCASLYTMAETCVNMKLLL